MMNYNESGYIKFLKLIYRLKLNYCCCKYRSMVADQLNELDSLDPNETHNTDIIEDTVIDTTIIKPKISQSMIQR